MDIKTLKDAMIVAYKSGDKFRKDTISDLISMIQKSTITSGGRVEATEELVNAALLKEKKTTQEMIETCPESRTDLLGTYKKRMDIINEFAPKIMSDADEILKFIESLGIEITKANRGKIMAALKGKVDMKVANKVISERM